MIKDLCSQYKRIVSIPTTIMNLNSDEWCALYVRIHIYECFKFYMVVQVNWYFFIGISVILCNLILLLFGHNFGLKRYSFCRLDVEDVAYWALYVYLSILLHYSITTPEIHFTTIYLLTLTNIHSILTGIYLLCRDSSQVNWPWVYLGKE